MNKPATPAIADDDIGPLDENGQQILSPEEEAMFEKMHADPAFWEDIARAEADIAAGRVHTDEEVREHMREVRARFLAERGL